MPLTTLRKAAAHPRVALGEGRAVCKAMLFRLLCKLTGRRFRAGRNFRIEGRLILQGPGEVVIGDNVRIAMTVTPWTYSPEARIEIGNDSYVNGTSFGCRKLIQIGPRAILARCHIMDTNFHSLSADRHSPAAPVKTESVVLEENVWVASNAGLLPGTKIGRNSVVGFGAVCTGEFPSDVLIAGNPAKVIRRIDERPWPSGHGTAPL